MLAVQQQPAFDIGDHDFDVLGDVAGIIHGRRIAGIDARHIIRPFGLDDDSASQGRLEQLRLARRHWKAADDLLRFTAGLEDRRAIISSINPFEDHLRVRTR